MHFDQLLLFLFESVFLVFRSHHLFELSNRRAVQRDADLLGRPPDQTRRQVHLDFHLGVDLEALGLVIHDRLGNFFSVRLVSSVVLDLDVKVEAAFTCIGLIAFGVGAVEVSLDLICTPSVVLLAAAEISLASRPLQVFRVVVELFDLQDALEERVPVHGLAENLLHEAFVLQVQLPVLVEVVFIRVVFRKLKRLQNLI